MAKTTRTASKDAGVSSPPPTSADAPPVQMQVALLRGINVGKAKRISMAELKALFEGLGYRHVKTLLNSGNVVFGVSHPGGDVPVDSEWPAVQPGPLEDAIRQHTEVSCRVMVITQGTLERMLAENLLKDVATDFSRLMVNVLSAPEDAARLEPLLTQNWGEERLLVGQEAVYTWLPHSVLESPLNVALSKRLKDRVTARNWSTMLKLQELVASSGKP